MSTTARVAAFVTALVAIFGGAWGVGAAVGPFDEPTPPSHAADGGHADEGDHASEESAPVAHTPGGLQVSEQGYTLDLAETTLAPGRSPVRFTITGPDGSPVRDFEEEHEKDLHLIVVRRDFTGYQHVHPVMAADGTWATDLDLTPGTWRVLADATPAGGPALTLGTDLQVTGRFIPAAHPGQVTSATVGRYTVDLGGDLDDGAVSVRVSRNGEAVTDLQPYLGAFGHLVALREGDLAYLHVHPEAGDAGPEVPFAVEVPTDGGYRLFFDFKHDGVVRTAELAVRTTPGGGNVDEH